MQKQNSKKKFLEKLYISLSFYFGDDDCDSIIKDYEEWFENEEMAEKSEHEICSGLGKPFDIARNLYKDSKEGKEHTFPLKSSVLLQTIATLVISYTWYYYLFNVFYKSVTYVLYRKNVWA